MARIDRLVLGNPGDAKALGSGVSEMKIGYGPGRRVYVSQRGKTLVILLCASDKSSQLRDFDRAKQLVQRL